MVFPSFTQLDAMDCGPTSLKIVAQYYGKHYSLQNLRERCHITREGVSLLGISDAAVDRFPHHGGKDDLGTIAGEGDTSLYRTLEPTTFRSRL